MATEARRELHMVQLDLDVRHLMTMARDRGWLGRLRGGRRWDDLGYLVHQHLTALFYDLAPQPFRAVAERGSSLTVLGYSQADADRLRRQADEFGRPAERASCRLGELCTKPMPASLFEPGRRLGFEVRACPVVRLAAANEARWCGKPATFKKGAELDVYLHRRYLRVQPDATEDGLAGGESREAVYVDWLRARLAGSARLLEARLHAFRRVRVLRQGRGEGGEREAWVSERPDALLTGTLAVDDPAAFRALLVRGVGRHRAFGFGMLLLRPAD